jgi:hypothetical protein
MSGAIIQPTLYVKISQLSKMRFLLFQLSFCYVLSYRPPKGGAFTELARLAYLIMRILPS